MREARGGTAVAWNDRLATTMSVDVATEIMTDRVLEDVAAYTENPDNANAWHVNIKSVEWKTQPPATVGSRITFVAKFLGRPPSLHVRDRRTRALRAAGHADAGGTVLDGEAVHMGSGR